MSAGPGPGEPAVPLPLGWCLPHLQAGEDVPAVTLFAGTAMCGTCALLVPDDDELALS